MKSEMVRTLVFGVIFSFMLTFGGSAFVSQANPSDELSFGNGVVRNPANGHYYELVEVYPGVSWYEARDAAAAMQYEGAPGHLATATSAQEEDFLVGTFPELDPEYVWLGASDEASESDWQWITGEVWDYTDWSAGEPNGGASENCLDFGDNDAKWNDESCDRPLNFYLVEYSSEEPITVAVDIKPGSCPNPFNVKSRGVLPVAVLGSEEFDVRTIDPTTIRLTREGYGEGVKPRRWSYEDVATPFEGELCDCHDLDGDGWLDLTLKFLTRQVMRTLELGNVDDTTFVSPLLVTGHLKEDAGAMPIEGSDCVRVLKKGK